MACGSEGDGGDYGGPPPDYSHLKNAPPPLDALYAQANKLIPGGQAAYDKVLAKLKGHPVVVNVWASWCGPCRSEFPYFQQASANLGKKVGFLGVDSDDSEKGAASFLEEYPVPYPSVTDPDKSLARGLLNYDGYPGTVFYGADGEQTNVHLGPYTSLEDLEADIKTYAR